MARNSLILLTAVLALSVSAPAAWASVEAPEAPRSYALVVGSNAAGEGQQPLKYAEDDAARVAEVLRELGGYSAERVRVLAGPNPEQLLATLDQIGVELARDAAEGVKSVFFFYYSGHARASALDLGRRQLSLERLRRRILALPTTLTVVVLDACQSGAFSRVKGAEPAADFSFNSVAGLHARGVAVMASSTGTELSQESERLRSSYFTHYLLVALRGAGDTDGDGRVSLDEAYRYAYAATLSSTARTAVGTQHVTLETELRGKGDVALTYPARADAQLELPSSLEGMVLVQVARSKAVVAELHKSAGSRLRLALPPGGYVALVRMGDRAVECSLTLEPQRTTQVATQHCRPVALEVAGSKGALPLSRRVAVELGAGLAGVVDDRYTERLSDFGFSNDTFVEPVFSVGVSYRLLRALHVVGEVGPLERAYWSRRSSSLVQEFDWKVLGGGVYFRAVLPTANERHALFAQVGGGVARGHTAYLERRVEASFGDAETDAHWGYHLGVSAGGYWMPFEHVGLFLRLRYDYAPVIDNLIGDVHDSGGGSMRVGIRTTF